MEDEKRVEYLLRLTVNARKLNRVVIDLHFQRRHPEMTIELIVALVKLLDGDAGAKEDENGEFEYFIKDPHVYEGKPYRLVYCLHRKEAYLGVINAFRIRRKK